jgi:hypothetical protein
MNSNTQGETCSFAYDEDPCQCVIRAVAWANGVKPETLTPLYRVVDPDALNALFSAETSTPLTVTFSYEGCRVEIRHDGHVLIQECPDSTGSEGDRTGNILVIEQTGEPDIDETSDDAFCLLPPEQYNLLLVTYPSTDNHQSLTIPFDWDEPENIGLIAMGDETRSATAFSPADQPDVKPPQVEAIPDPSDLSTLGIRINERILAWKNCEQQTVLYFPSLTELLLHVDPPEAFRFLHILTARVNSAEATAYYHVTEGETSEHTVETLKPLFDTVLNRRVRHSDR